jgi:hypothetical protein
MKSYYLANSWQNIPSNVCTTYVPMEAELLLLLLLAVTEGQSSK